MPSLAAAKASNSNWSPNYVPVAVFVGGTSGVGQHMAEALAKYTSGRVDIILAGRHAEPAQKILDSLPKHEGARREFIQVDVGLMKNVKAFTDDLVTRLPKVNFLVMSAGYARLFGKREETEEGIDHVMAMRYYHRWKLIHGLLPLLRKARDLGEDARVISILGATISFRVDLDDLALRKNYSAFRASIWTVIYNDYMVEEYAIREPGIAFRHIYPGFIPTQQVTGPYTNHWLLRYIAPAITGLLNLILTSEEDCAEYMWYGALDGEPGFGRYSNKGNRLNNHIGDPRTRQAIWEHSAAETGTTDGV